MTTHTPADIVRLVRATSNGEFALSGQEAELLVRLFAASEATSAEAELLVRIGKTTERMFNEASQ